MIPKANALNDQFTCKLYAPCWIEFNLRLACTIQLVDFGEKLLLHLKSTWQTEGRHRRLEYNLTISRVTSYTLSYEIAVFNAGWPLFLSRCDMGRTNGRRRGDELESFPLTASCSLKASFDNW